MSEFTLRAKKKRRATTGQFKDSAHTHPFWLDVQDESGIMHISTIIMVPGEIGGQSIKNTPVKIILFIALNHP
jgi:hypothetical protein